MNIDSFTAIEGYALAAKTSDAYMADSYGPEEWFNCVCFLLLEGYKADDVVEIVRSKHMRWSSDAEGIQTGDEFQLYYQANQKHIIKMLHNE